MIISAIIFRSKGSVVMLETLRIVAPKGCLLIPSYLKFSMSKKRAMIRWRLVRSYLWDVGYVKVKQIGKGIWGFEYCEAVVEFWEEVALDLLKSLIFRVENFVEFL